MKQVPMFKMLSDEDIENILKDSQELIFQQDTYIVKQHDIIKGSTLIEGIYIIVRGSGTEVAESWDIMYKEKKSKFDVISPHYIVSSAFRYPTCNIIILKNHF